MLETVPSPNLSDVFTNSFAQDIYRSRYSKDGLETWKDTTERVVESVIGSALPQHVKQQLKRLIYERKFIPAGRYLYSAGREFHQYNNCFLFKAEDSREGWADLSSKAVSSLMTGGGIGVDYTPIRPNGYPVGRTGGKATGPLSVMHIVNESGRYVMQGGQRRSAIWAGLSWFHPDVLDFLRIKNWDERVREIKERDFSFPAQMELTNVSVIYDDVFFDLLEGTIDEPTAMSRLSSRHEWLAKDPATFRSWVMREGNGSLRGLAERVWLLNSRGAFKTGEPGWSMNYRDHTESLRNACTEVVSSDDSDKCNLGTVWMQAHESLQDFEHTLALATKFLLVGGMHSHVPTDKIRRVGNENNRIGVGLGGMAEWLMQRGMRYEVTPELRSWLESYEAVTDTEAELTAKYLGVRTPAGKRAIAPTGTIGIVAETTTGIEPLFCAAYLRRYYKDGRWYEQYVVDGAVKKLLKRGIAVEQMFDAYDLGLEERVSFQADVQDYVDMSISSTVNIPAWGSELNNEDQISANSEVVRRYAKRLRGLTVYPDGARGGQPLTKVDLATALANEGRVFEEHEHECVGGVCGL